MARRKKSSRRAAPRFARRARTVYRTVSRRARRSGRAVGRSSLGGWLPLSMSESALDFGVGAITPAANNLVAPIVDPYLGWAGAYKDEVRTALIGVAAYKIGGGLIKNAGREMFRFAVLSAGQQTGLNFGIGTQSHGSSTSAGVVIA